MAVVGDPGGGFVTCHRIKIAPRGRSPRGRRCFVMNSIGTKLEIFWVQFKRTCQNTQKTVLNLKNFACVVVHRLPFP